MQTGCLTAEQVMGKARKAELLVGQGRIAEAACRALLSASKRILAAYGIRGMGIDQSHRRYRTGRIPG